MNKCGNCDNPLVCRECRSKFTFAGREAFEAFHDRREPVHCPTCANVLTRKYCGYAYDGGDYEYGRQ